LDTYEIDNYYNLLLVRNYLGYLETQKPAYEMVTNMKRTVNEELDILKKELESKGSKNNEKGHYQGKHIQSKLSKLYYMPHMN